MDDLKETFQGHYDQKEVDNLVSKALRPQKSKEKTLEQVRREQYRRRQQEIDWH